MGKQEKELLKIFQDMSNDTRDLFLSYGRIAVVAEECVRRQYGLSAGGGLGQAVQAAAEPQAGAGV
jgi:hypothetical protein